MFFAISLIVVYLCSHWKRYIWDRLVKYALPVSFLLMLLPLTPLKQTINGNTSWIRLGPLTMQPSEFAKIGLILWCAAKLQKYELKALAKSSTRHVAFLLPGTAIIIALILKGGDLGTTIIILGIVAGMLFVSGLALRHFISVGAVLGIGVGFLVFMAPYRLHRFTAVLNPFAPSVYKFAGWQPAHSLMGLASGGLFGVGLGASRQKWGNLTEAHTDFIFSVIGEELGLLGTLIVLVGRSDFALCELWRIIFNRKFCRNRLCSQCGTQRSRYSPGSSRPKESITFNDKENCSFRSSRNRWAC